MSTDWNVHCVDCDDTTEFSDANHREDLMFYLIKKADLLADFDAFFTDDGYKQIWDDVELRVHYGYIQTSFFAKHRGHRLVARSEYGDILEAPK